MMPNNDNGFDFENEILSFKSNINGFTKSIFKDFDSTDSSISLEKKIKDLFDGKKVNYTENKAALHVKNRLELNEVWDGFDVLLMEKKLGGSFKLKDGKPDTKIKNIFVLGIGGSFEGPKLLLESLSSHKSFFNIEFITGSDQFEFIYKTKDIKPSETLFIVSSKSFTTDETLFSLNEAIKWSGNMNNFIAVTANKDEALKYNIDEDWIIPLNEEIGGRYSIWSAICLPAYIEFKCGNSGIQDEYFNHGARNSDEIEMFCLGGKSADRDLIENKEYLEFVKTLSYSDIYLNNERNFNARAVLSYNWRLRSFADYVQQLEMESLGKQPNGHWENTGQIIFGGYGPTAQHSYFQLLHEGTASIAADIIVSKEDSSSLAYAQAITQAKLLSNGYIGNIKGGMGKTPVNLFLLNKLDSYTLGYLIATWEHRTFITAAMHEINPFDQFGVSAGKIATKKYLEENGG